MTPPLDSLVEPVLALAREAGVAIMAIYRRGYSIQQKADQSPVTDADLAAHAILVPGLSALTPDIPVLSEEAAAIPTAERREWTALWLVDPLDGTREFIRRNPEFSVNIALIVDHEPVFGLILIPATGVAYWGYRNAGARRCDPESDPRPIYTRPLSEGPVMIAGSLAAYGDRAVQRYLEYIGRHQYLAVGSALKSCLVAEGKADLYPRFGPTAEWDTAAAQVILEQAGGGLTDTFMHPLRYNARPTLINPDFFAFGDERQDWSLYLPRRKPRFN